MLRMRRTSDAWRPIARCGRRAAKAGARGSVAKADGGRCRFRLWANEPRAKPRESQGGSKEEHWRTHEPRAVIHNNNNINTHVHVHTYTLLQLSPVTGAHAGLCRVCGVGGYQRAPLVDAGSLQSCLSEIQTLNITSHNIFCPTLAELTTVNPWWLQCGGQSAKSSLHCNHRVIGPSLPTSLQVRAHGLQGHRRAIVHTVAAVGEMDRDA
jgi:hypothetical protein